MGIGHVALAFASKRFAPQVSLGLLIYAGLLVDQLFAVMVLLGLEHARIQPGATAAYPFVLDDYPITHSLVAGLGWAALAGGAYFWLRRDRAGAALIAVGVVSHWLLDVVAHAPDMPVLPHGPYLGLGLWNSLPATLLVEAVLAGAGVAIYVASTRPRDRQGRWGLAALVVAMGAIHLAVYLGPPPPTMTAAAAGMFLLVVPMLFAHWVDRHRAPALLEVEAATAR